ncbi:serine palmitoyltransferase component [Tulasnella sp. 403]|nr:serine palmitoyltransferase component [Tulasnella sp. 403]
MPSPMGLRSPSPSSAPSMFSKKRSTPSLTNATAYLAAVAEADRRAQAGNSTPSISSTSTPALSFSSSITADSSSATTRMAGDDHHDLDEAYDEDDETGLTRPTNPPTSEQVFSTRHVEFGHCANPAYRYTSEYKPGSAFHAEEEPPYYILFSTYISYLCLIILGHVRDFFGKRFRSSSYSHLMPHDFVVRGVCESAAAGEASTRQPFSEERLTERIWFQGYAALTSDFDSFYTRRLKTRLDDTFSRPVTGVPGRTIVCLDRVSDDYNKTFRLNGNRTRALNVSSYNYLGFAQARGGCADAVEQGIRRYGVSACGSRLEGGTTDLHVQAEALVARFVGMEDALITSMGYATNSTTIPALAGKGCLVISDEFNHASIRVGVRLSGATIRTFKHNDVKDLENLLREVISQGQPRTHRPWKKILLIVEGLYSMEGTLVNLPAIMDLKKRYKACLAFYLYVDEAHSIGAMGPHGRGVVDYFKINPHDVDILMGTFTKSFGASGGYIAGNKALISRLRLRTHAGPYAESMSPAVLTQIIASMSSIMGVADEPALTVSFPSPAPASAIPPWLLDQLPPALRDGSEGRERLRRLAFNARYLSRALIKLGFITFGHADSAIIPLLLFNPGKMGLFSRLMLERKTPIVVVVVGYPATPLVTSRVRFCLSAAHTKEDVDTLLRAIDDVGDLLDLKHGPERCTVTSLTSTPALRRSLATATNPSGLETASPIMPKITTQNVNPAFLNVEYAVRGELAIKAEVYREMLKTEEGRQKLPFDRVVNSNIGNPQQKGLDQKPLTFGRQVAALLEYPPLMERDDLFPPDVVARAKELYAEIGSIGAYSHSQGVPFIRKNVASFIAKRDGFPANPNHIFLTAGASFGVDLTLDLLISSKNSGILIPIPQYPLYTAAIARHSGVPVPYYLDESKGWSTNPAEVEAAIIKGKQDGVELKALVVINPGNPTGSVLEESVQLELVKLCEKYELVLLADEVYQDNLHDRPNHTFTSFKKLVRQLDSPIPLVSFHSISKGVTGECGRRGGYFELTNFSDELVALIYKMVSVGLCPPLGGQVGVDCLVRPPAEGEASYALWKEETTAIHNALAQRSRIMSERLNTLPGMSCAPALGALYLYPKIELLPKQIEEAKKIGKAPDMFYALQLLDQTGICAIPGSGFGQKEGEGHFRLTCLCDGVEEYVGKLEKFHKEFYAKYSA